MLAIESPAADRGLSDVSDPAGRAPDAGPPATDAGPPAQRGLSDVSDPADGAPDAGPPAADGGAPAADPADMNLDRAWRLHPQVALRPERFGALAYHFGTRRLSFLKSRELHEIVRGLNGEASAREVCRAAGVPEREMPRYKHALATLAACDMITPADRR